MNRIQDNCPNRRVLVVDDNEAIHEDFRKILGADSMTAELDEADGHRQLRQAHSRG